MKNILVIKFGGTSLGTIERIKNAAKIVAQEASTRKHIVVVVSAMGHTTDELISLSSNITSVPNRREMDALMATGEQVSAALVTMALQSCGLRARSFSGAQAKILTNRQFGDAKIEQINPRAMILSLEENYIPVVTGFQGASVSGEVTTLGRGGSDTTAIALAAALKAERCDIYTDVDAIYSTDPRIVPNAARLEALSVYEMLELAKNGAQVLNARSVEVARDRNVAVRVRSTFKPSDPGTLITNICSESRTFTGVSINKNVNCIEFKLEKLELGHDRSLRSLRIARANTKSELLKLLSGVGIHADIIAAGRPNPFRIVLKVQKPDTLTAVATLHKASLSPKAVTVKTDIASIVVVATEITTRHEVEALSVMMACDIPVIALSMGAKVLSLFVPADRAEEGLKAIHARFLEVDSSRLTAATSEVFGPRASEKMPATSRA